MKYQVWLNQGNEAIGSGKTITANEVVETVDEKALAREIHHLVLANFCQAAAQLMAMGYAVVLKNGNDAALRIYPDIHLRGGNINLARAKELDPTVTDLTLENAGDLATKAGVTVRAKAECESKFTELLLAQVARKENQGGNQGGGTNTNPNDNGELG